MENAETRVDASAVGPLNCPHNEMKLNQNSFKTVFKQFWNCFVSVHFVVRTVLRKAECMCVKSRLVVKVHCNCSAAEGADTKQSCVSRCKDRYEIDNESLRH